MAKKNLAVFLLFILFLDLFKFGPKLLLHFSVIVGSTFLTDYLLIKIRRSGSFFPWAALVSGLIIGFVLDPSAQIVFKIVAPILAITSKHFLKLKNRHLLNPAAFGLFTAALFGASISWWVGRSGWLVDLVLVLGMFFSLRRIGKLNIAFSFLAAFFLVTLLVYQELNLWFSLFFFPLVMLPEPMTSPSLPREQVAYGALAALLLVFFGFSQLILADSFLQTLVIVNLFASFGLIKKVLGVLQI